MKERPSADSGPAPAASGPPRILVVSASHGLPPTQPRPWRLLELFRHLARRGVEVEGLLWQERPLDRRERGRLTALSLELGEIGAVLDPAFASARGRLGAWLAGRFPLLAGRARRARLRLLCSEIASRSARRACHAAIIGSPRLLEVADALPPSTRTILDLSYDEGRVRAAHRALGREDALEEPPDRGRASRPVALDRFDAVLVPSDQMARRLASLGATPLVVPPIGEPSAPGAPAAPARPPRVLAVGSETVVNLDGLRWFRRRVLPRISRAVPSCRLRVVGEAGRHLVPGPDIDRVGWVDDIDRELREAAVVLLPPRSGGRLSRRLVEALAAGCAVALGGEAAQAAGLVGPRDAVVASDERSLAEGVISVLRSDRERERLEARARDIARERFAPEVAMAPLLRFLGIEPVPDPERLEAVRRGG